MKTTLDDRIEKEANAFALCLLMPSQLFMSECTKLKWDLSDDRAIKSLANTFQVPLSAVVVRMSMLKIF